MHTLLISQNILFFLLFFSPNNLKYIKIQIGTNKIQKGGAGVRGDGDGLGQALRGGRNRNRRGGRGSNPPSDRVLKV